MNSRLINGVSHYWWQCTLLLITLITALSLWPLATLPALPGSDKTHHLIAYAALMLPTALRRPRYWVLLGGLFIGYSGAIELLQPYVNRYGEWLDLAANGAGVLAGAVLGLLIRAGSRGSVGNTGG